MATAFAAKVAVVRKMHFDIRNNWFESKFFSDRIYVFVAVEALHRYYVFNPKSRYELNNCLLIAFSV